MYYSTNVEHMQRRVQYCASYVNTTLVLLEISNATCAKGIQISNKIIRIVSCKDCC